MTMALAIYSLAVATIYALLYTASPDTAQTLTVFFGVAVLLPAIAHEGRRNRR